ncbi:MAG: glycerol-3-phosphate 1-O-acyltransferase PlsY [Desulfarculus sp.]|nr:glycerol-3-phosphate 1-O-acyltransferase PlsY [Desulfarculus sp.]
MLLFLGLFIGAYLLGSVPFGLAMARLAGGSDPRRAGSGNIGATNVARLAGKTAGAATLLLDAGKGWLPAYLAWGWLEPWQAAAVGLAAVLGHIFPIYLRFQGGKGVATALGAMLAAAPLATLVVLGILAGIAWWTTHMSVGSLAGIGSAPLVMLFLGQPTPLVLSTVGMALLVVWRHRDNIVRLRQGRENRLR